MSSVNWTDVIVTVLSAAATGGVAITLNTVFKVLSKVIALEGNHSALAKVVSEALANPDIVKYSDLARNGQILTHIPKTGAKQP